MKIKVTRLFRGVEEDRDFSPGEILTTKECTEDRLKLFVEKEVAEEIKETSKDEKPSEDALAAEEPKKRTVARKKKTEE